MAIKLTKPGQRVARKIGRGAKKVEKAVARGRNRGMMERKHIGKKIARAAKPIRRSAERQAGRLAKKVKKAGIRQ